MRFASFVVAATVAVSSLTAVPAGAAEPTTPPAVLVDGELHVLVDGTYRKVDRDLPSEVRGKLSENEDAEKPDIAKWLIPLLVTGSLVVGVAQVLHKLYPSGRLILYFQPGDTFKR